MADLSNFDKHQALHVVGGVVLTGELRLTRVGTGEVVPFDGVELIQGPFEDGALVMRIMRGALDAAVAEGGVGMEPNLTFQIAFGEGGPCAGQPVLDSLGRVEASTVFLTSYFESWFAPGSVGTYFGAQPSADGD